MRPIQILTGGNLRLLTILSTFGAQPSLRQLMHDLVRLVDEHTEYFKSHLDSLPSTERKVYLALADRWNPSTAREVAATARMEVSPTSSLLRRLVNRGAAVTLDAPGRTNWYQVAERMYNIYYLFRRRSAPAERVRAAVRFMISFYQPEELVAAARRIADELPSLTVSSAQKAVALAPADGECLHTLASIQCAAGRLQEALKTAAKYLADTDAVRKTVKNAIDLFVHLAACGQAREALRVVIRFAVLRATRTISRRDSPVPARRCQSRRRNPRDRSRRGPTHRTAGTGRTVISGWRAALPATARSARC